MKILVFVQKNIFLLTVVFTWVVFASPYFFQQKTPYPATFQVNHFPPWSYYSERFASPVKNAAMPDIVDQIYPWRFLSIEMWKNGQIPLWNPYNFAGNPLLANFQSATLSPFNILFFVFPFIDAWSIIIVLQPLIMGLSTYALMRELHRSREASAISSIAAMFCGFLVVWMAYGTLSLAFSFLPLSLLFVEKFKSSKSLKYLFLFSITIPFSFFSGHFQTSIYVEFFVFFYLLFSFFTSDKRINIYLLIAFILGMLMSMIQIIPSVEFYNYSVRSESFNNAGGIPLKYLVTIFSPDFYGNPVTRNDWYGYYAEWASFVGIIPFAFALLTLLFWRKTDTVAKLLLVMAITVLLLAVQSPLQSIIGALKIPVISTSNPTRIISLFSFSIALLAGYGYDLLLQEKNRSRSRLVIWLVANSIIFLVLWGALQLFEFVPKEHVAVARRNFILPTAVFCTFSILIFLHFVTKNKKLLSMLVFSTILLIGFDSYRFASKWIPFEEKSLVFADVKVIPQLQKSLGDERYFGNLGAQVASFYKLASLDGYDPLYIQKYGEFVRSSNDGEFSEAERSVVRVPRTGVNTDKLLDVAGVKVVFHPKADTNQSWAYPVWEKSSRLLKFYEDDRFEFYENTSVLPRFSLYYQYEVAQGAGLLKKFYEKDFDYRRKLLLDHDIGYQPAIGTGSAKITSYTANRVTGEVSTDKTALLFLADNYYPGWKAYIDGQETAIYVANYTFRAILIPEGKHKVEFVYEPDSFRLGGVISFVSLQALLATIGILHHMRKKYN